MSYPPPGGPPQQPYDPNQPQYGQPTPQQPYGQPTPPPQQYGQPPQAYQQPYDASQQPVYPPQAVGYNVPGQVGVLDQSQSRLWSALCYPIPFFSIVISLLMYLGVLGPQYKNDRFLRYNALHGLVWAGSAFVLWILLVIFRSMVDIVTNSTAIGFAGGCCTCGLDLLLLGAGIYFAYNAYTGKEFPIAALTGIVRNIDKTV